jgi:hypothetical protein
VNMCQLTSIVRMLPSDIDGTYGSKCKNDENKYNPYVAAREMTCKAVRKNKFRMQPIANSQSLGRSRLSQRDWSYKIMS